MTQLFVISTIILALVFIYIYVLKGSRGKDKHSKLWQECRRQLRLPPKLADETIERHIQRLKKRHPNRAQSWYLEKILYDLEREHR